MLPYTFYPIGDDGLLIKFTHHDSRELLTYIHELVNRLLTQNLTGILDIVPAFESIAIYYNLNVYSYQKLQEKLIPYLLDSYSFQAVPSRLVTVPVCYEDAVALDIIEVASIHGLSTKEVIEIHTNTLFTVAIIGFLPGFPYLTGLPEQLWTERKATPRTSVQKGAVAIGGTYTGIYSLSSPGGWNIIGQTPLSLFNQKRKHPFLLQPGDQVRFQPITLKELEDWS